MTVASIYALPDFDPSSQNANLSYAINDLGVAVGYADGSDGPSAASWTNRSITSLGALSGDSFSIARGINDSGATVGYSATGPFNLSHATLWQNGTATLIGNITDFSQANAINDLGQVVGVGGTAGAVDSAFVWQNGTLTYLPNLAGVTNSSSSSYDGDAYAINDAGQIVGIALTGQGYDHAALWQNGAITDLGTLSGDVSSTAYDINKAGVIVGASAGSVTTAVEWVGGVIKALPNLTGFASFAAEGINDSGVIVGTASPATYSAYGSRAVIWQNGTVVNLNSDLPANSGWTLLTAIGIGNDGAITGEGLFNGIETSYVMTLGAASASMTAAAATQSFQKGSLAAPVSIADNSQAVQADLDALQSLAAAGLLNTITLSDAAGLPAGSFVQLTVTGAQLAADKTVLADIVSDYQVSITGATTVAGLSEALVNRVDSLTVDDSATHVAAALDLITNLALDTDVTVNLTDGGIPVLAITGEQAGEAVGLATIKGSYSLSVAATAGNQVATAAANPHVVAITLDTYASNVAGFIDQMEPAAASGLLKSITLDDGGTPVLDITAAQAAKDGPVLAAITTPYTLTVEAGSTSATLAAPAGHGLTVDFSGKAGQYSISAGADGSVTVSGNGVTDHLSGVTELHFSDYSEILAQAPGNGSVTTGNITELYSAVFAREPDVGGLSFYQNYLTANPGTPLLQFAQWFLGSSEYTGNGTHAYAQTTAGETQFITDSYKNLLDRAPAASDITFYLGKVIQPALTGLTAGTAAYAAADAQAHAQMLVYFSASAEFLTDVQVTAQSPASAQHWLVLA